MERVSGFAIDDAWTKLIFNGTIRMHKILLNKKSINKYEKADGGYRLNRNGFYLLFGIYKGQLYVYVGESAKSADQGVKGRLFCHITDGSKAKTFEQVNLGDASQMKKFLTHAIIITDTDESTFLENSMNIVQALETVFTNMSIFASKAKSLNTQKTYHTISAKDLEVAQNIVMEVFDNLDSVDRNVLKPNYLIQVIPKKDTTVSFMKHNVSKNDTRVYMKNNLIMKGSYFECGKNTLTNSSSAVSLLGTLFREKKLALVVKDDKFVYAFMEDLDVNTIDTKKGGNDLESLAKLLANDYTAKYNEIWKHGNND